jgi:2-iminobutanoate/2-iminopropanoate deaminase
LRRPWSGRCGTILANPVNRSASCLAILVVAPALGGCAPLRPGTTYIQAEKALGPYSGSVLSADFCFVSGKLGEGGSSFEHEVETAIQALEHELDRAGLTLRQVVQVTAYLTDIEYYQAFNEVYAARFPQPYPARTLVEVVALPAGARVEIQAVARRH